MQRQNNNPKQLKSPTLGENRIIKYKSKKSDILDANTLTFEVKEKNSTNKKSNHDILTEAIFKLVESYKLTTEEISGFLVEHPKIKENEKDIQRFIEKLVKEQFLLKVQVGNEEIIKVDKKTEKWSSISREKSREWINTNTELNDFFISARKIYNNVVKRLNVNSENTYYRIYEPTDEPMVVKVNNKTGIMFSSNDYLGLSKHPRVIHACNKALKKYGLGGCGSRVSIGTTNIHVELEKKITSFKNSQSSVVLSSGYLTNLAFISILNKDTVIIYDSLSHACIIHGTLTSGNESARFKHNDVNALEKKLKKYPYERNKLIYIESVYSLDGDIAPLPEIINLAKKYNAKIAVDEAHSTGTIGMRGKGICEHFSLDSSLVDFKIGTLSKAIGAEGGFICANTRIIEAFKYAVNPYLFTTSKPPSVSSGALEAINLIEEEPKLVLDLQRKSKQLRNKLNGLGFNTGNSATQIIPVMIPNDEKVHIMKNQLEGAGIFVIVAMYPTVPLKKSRLRINISSSHTDNQIDKLIEALEFYGKKLGIISV